MKNDLIINELNQLLWVTEYPSVTGSDKVYLLESYIQL